jgi:hypothetical protein
MTECLAGGMKISRAEATEGKSILSYVSKVQQGVHFLKFELIYVPAKAVHVEVWLTRIVVPGGATKTT